jgi:hypothetical protein
VATVLHGALFRLHEGGMAGKALQNLVARLCEKWWTTERPGAELLVTSLMPYLIIKSIEPSARLVSLIQAMQYKPSFLTNYPFIAVG